MSAQGTLQGKDDKPIDSDNNPSKNDSSSLPLADENPVIADTADVLSAPTIATDFSSSTSSSETNEPIEILAPESTPEEDPTSDPKPEQTNSDDSEVETESSRQEDAIGSSEIESIKSADTPSLDPDTTPLQQEQGSEISETPANDKVLSQQDEVSKNAQNDSTSAEVVSSSNDPYPYTIQQLLDMVIERNASDLHLTVNYPAMLRIDGKLTPVGDSRPLTEEDAVGLILPLLPEQKKELLEVNREVDFAHAHKEDARFRINSYYQKQTLAAAMRLIPNTIRSIDELKLPQIYHQLAKLRQGLVLVTGPTGSGKSTTLAALIQEINESRPDHIITIEDPIEYIFPLGQSMIDQRELHDDTHSWEIALKSALRQDPDDLLIGEMRDFETIAAAITLAETGHLVFATLHTNNAAQTVDRIIDVFPEHQQAQVRSQVSNVLEAVVAQRLIPLNRGGRSAVSEIMIATPAIRNLIREAKSHQIDNVIRTSADVGMVSLEHSLVSLVRENLINMDRAQEYAVHPEEIVRLLKA
ncbi:type IV pilus twitching motility protein PilT [Candidatus Nomurabacteria bacterium]|nr:type IV pilus twitching motility protein PilT [Candidatus Nomurabacteria bacterium]